MSLTVPSSPMWWFVRHSALNSKRHWKRNVPLVVIFLTKTCPKYS